jgi:hypothetical protein
MKFSRNLLCAVVESIECLSDGEIYSNALEAPCLSLFFYPPPPLWKAPEQSSLLPFTFINHPTAEFFSTDVAQ